MKILLLESFYTSSHKQWADALVAYSSHEIKMCSLPGRHWKWRMHHAGKHFANEITDLNTSFDLILCSDLMNVAELRGLLAISGKGKAWYNEVPVLTYFHENQITYPWSADDEDVRLNRDNHYGWINYISCLASDAILFNSTFHRKSFLNALPTFLNQFPDSKKDNHIDGLLNKAFVLPIALQLEPLTKLQRIENEVPIVLWNHRWEYDKNPNLFFSTLIELMQEGINFKVVVAGERYKKYPKIFDEAHQILQNRVVHFGYAQSRNEYLNLLQQSDIVPVTSNQDFFGISAVEAIAAGCNPILPNRLAFEEHLEQPEEQKYYYDTSRTFKSKLKEMIIDFKNRDDTLKYRMLKYDIDQVISQYDSLFIKVREEFNL